jgi:hypothetical protein
MDQILPPELNDFEFQAMRQIAAHLVTLHIPSRIQFRLKDIGYAKEASGGLVLTMTGYNGCDGKMTDTDKHPKRPRTPTRIAKDESK